ncbi:MAG: hypothetical protein QF437_15615 [Planctomycetota bacterium]|jgi:hypothetical protein|nr:hypothetical protein [Planctomycetota bacterium]MDP7131924.1 hypothetical protein [Planctomycetota bacterium]MDP7249933.1 hypothetical protein [Planctomycetota bacterium]
MTKLLNGIIHGKTVELSDDPGMEDGQEVEVMVRLAKENGNWGDGLRRCAGALADSWTEEDDRILDQIYKERQTDSRPEIEE